MKLYRAMKAAADGLPEVGPSARTLGVRPGDAAPHNDVLAVTPTDTVALTVDVWRWPKARSRNSNSGSCPPKAAPDAVLFDDLVRLITQGIATAPKQSPQISTTGAFVAPPDNSQNALEAKMCSRTDSASKASEAAVAKPAEIAKQPDGDAQLADEALAAAQDVVAAVQRMLLRGIAVRVPDGAK